MVTLITGASGFLGGAVARALPEVLATGRDPARCAALAAELGQPVLVLDLATGDIDALIAAARAAGVRRIVHAAAMTAPWGRMRDFHRSNVEATKAVLRVAAALRVERMVHVSTPSVYFRFADQHRVPETAPLPPPVNAYAATKAQAEALARAAGAVILRPRGIYGPGDRALLPRLRRAMAQGPLPLLRDGKAATDLTYVGDVAAAVTAALAVPGIGGRVYNISGGQALALRDVVSAVAERAGLMPQWRRLPLAPAMLAARTIEALAHLRGREPRVTRYGLGLFAYTQTLDISKAAADLGWSPQTGFADGLARVFEGAAEWS